MPEWLQGVAVAAAILSLYFGIRAIVQEAVKTGIIPLAERIEVLEHRLTDAIDQISDDSQTEELDEIEKELGREQITDIQASINDVQEQLTEIHEQLKDAQRQLYSISAGPLDNLEVDSAACGPLVDDPAQRASASSDSRS
jgi:hypothetical protein